MAFVDNLAWPSAFEVNPDLFGFLRLRSLGAGRLGPKEERWVRSPRFVGSHSLSPIVEIFRSLDHFDVKKYFAAHQAKCRCNRRFQRIAGLLRITK